MAAEGRRGVALIFVVVTLAVMLIMATVIVVNTASGRHQERVRQATSALLRFRSEFGAQGNAPSFIQDLNQAPGRLSHLYVKLTNQDRDSCGAPYGQQEINNWRGPYHLVPMLRDSNYQIEPGLVAIDTLMRTPPSATGQQAGTLSMIMRNVAIELAQDIGMAMDGVNTGAGPQITFTPNGTNPVTVFFNVPIQGC
jgi:hypothetical protein